MVRKGIKQSILTLPSPIFLIIAILAVGIFAGVDIQIKRALADDEGDDNHHNFCDNHHIAKCFKNDGTPLILPFP